MAVLGALLLNPPAGDGAQTIRHLRLAGALLGCEGLEIANLFAFPTRDVNGINAVGGDAVGWEMARPRLQEVIANSDQIMAAWGVSGISGAAMKMKQNQLDFLLTCFSATETEAVWTLNGEARHPSRWHQYVSDKHGRARGATFVERLESVMVARHPSSVW